MGIVLEIGKLVAASWVYTHWKETAFLLKTYLCLIHTSICNLLAEINAISELENKMENISPVIAKFSSIIYYY